jgi:outer membrane protein OmpA-like peptidoglycan-associated protein
MKKQKVNRILHNVQGGGKNVLSTLLFVILFNVAYSQDTTKGNHWYFGASGGTELGQCTFRSITDDKNKLGGTVGIFGGYELSPVFSVEAAANIGSMKLHAQECDPFWLSDEHKTYFAPVIDQNGVFYRDITAKSKNVKLALQLNIDILKIFAEPCNRFSLTISPQISYINTKTKFDADNFSKKFDAQNHFGYGAQAAFGCFVAKKIQLQLYAGITSLAGDRFDNIPKHHHDSNLIMDGGIKIAYRSGRTCGQKPAEPYTDITTPEIDTTTQVVDIPVVDTTQNVVAVDTVKESIPDTPVVEDNKPIITSALSTIFFADNGITISPKEAPKFREVVLYLKDHPDTKISIYGYCSKSGTDEYNKYLSQRRAELIKRRLMQQGVTEDRFKNVVGKGIDHAAPDNKSARRVEIVVED